MNVTAELSPDPQIAHIRIVAAAVATAVIVDVVAVQAPYLAVVGLPFVLTAALLRRGHAPSLIVVALLSLGFAAICINYALAGFTNAPWGDIVFVALGGPASLLLAGLCVVAIAHKRH